MNTKRSYEFKNNLSELDDLCRKLEQFCHPLGLPQKCLFEIHLSVEEHFSNIISYGYTDNKDHLITVTLSHDNKTVVIIIEDDGVPFNPHEAKSPDINRALEEREVGGLGIYLTRECMNEMAYQRKKNKNILTLTKHI